MCQSEKYGKCSSQDLPELFYTFFLLARKKNAVRRLCELLNELINIPFLQYINKTGFRACVKELYEAKYDPLSVTYTVLSGKSSTATKLINFSTYNSLNNKKKRNTSNTQKKCTKTGGNNENCIRVMMKNNVHPFFQIRFQVYNGVLYNTCSYFCLMYCLYFVLNKKLLLFHFLF